MRPVVCEKCGYHTCRCKWPKEALELVYELEQDLRRRGCHECGVTDGCHRGNCLQGQQDYIDHLIGAEQFLRRENDGLRNGCKNLINEWSDEIKRLRQHRQNLLAQGCPARSTSSELETLEGCVYELEELLKRDWNNNDVH